MQLLRFPCLKYAFLAIALAACTGGRQIDTVQTSFIELNSGSASDSAVAAIIQPYKTAVDKEMNEVLIISDQPLTKGEPEGSLGNFVADLVLKQGNLHYDPVDKIKADFCLLNNGGLRNSLPKGGITKGNVFELMPFENEMVVLTLTGAKVKELFNHIAAKNGMPVSGVKLGIKDNSYTKAEINGAPFDESKTYKVITSDYLALGGDKMDFFKGPVNIELLNYKIRDAIIDFMKQENKKGNTISASTDGRVYYDK